MHNRVYANDIFINCEQNQVRKTRNYGASEIFIYKWKLEGIISCPLKYKIKRFKKFQIQTWQTIPVVLLRVVNIEFRFPAN